MFFVREAVYVGGDSIFVRGRTADVIYGLARR